MLRHGCQLFPIQAKPDCIGSVSIENILQCIDVWNCKVDSVVYNAYTPLLMTASGIGTNADAVSISEQVQIVCFIAL